MNKKILSLIIVGIFLFSLTSISSIEFTPNNYFGEYEQNQDILLKQGCNDATYINISSISFPNSTIAKSNIEMNYTGSGQYVYNFNQTQDIGTYKVMGISDGCINSFEYSFDVVKPVDNGVFGLNNFNDTISIIVFVSFLVLAGVLLYFNQTVMSALIIIIEGFILLINNVNIILSMLLIAVGFIISFMGGRE